jgi:hypothetical protein
MTEDVKHTPLPVAGYSKQSGLNVEEVNINKHLEEVVLRRLDQLAKLPGTDGRWLQIGRTAAEQAFMAINRAVFKPSRIDLDPAAIEKLLSDLK